jgi:hypothetical protein
MSAPNNISDPLFAIYKKGVHLGNTRATSKIEAVRVYLLDSGFSAKDLLNTKLGEQYEAVKAQKGIHF